MSLYAPDMVAELPIDVRDVFDREFSYADAAGYVCSCMPGYEGKISFRDCFSPEFVSMSCLVLNIQVTIVK